MAKMAITHGLVCANAHAVAVMAVMRGIYLSILRMVRAFSYTGGRGSRYYGYLEPLLCYLVSLSAFISSATALMSFAAARIIIAVEVMSASVQVIMSCIIAPTFRLLSVFLADTYIIT